MLMESYDVQLQCILANGLHHVYCNVIAGILCRRDVAGEKGAELSSNLQTDLHVYAELQPHNVRIDPAMSLIVLCTSWSQVCLNLFRAYTSSRVLCGATSRRLEGRRGD